jgi:hypothetical protein
MPKVVDDGPWKQVFISERELAALRRVIELAVPQIDTAYDDAYAIKTVVEIIETSAVAHQQTMAAIQRAIDKKQKEDQKQ